MRRFLEKIKSEDFARDILIILNRGGWGDGDIEDETEAKSILEGIEDIVRGFGLKCRTVMFRRLESRRLKEKLLYIKDAIFAFSKEGEILAKGIKELLQRANDLKILLVGYSNGAAVNIQVMKRIQDDPRIVSIQLGAPFFVREKGDIRILDIRQRFDLFARGNIISFLLAAIMALSLAILKWITLRERNLIRAIKIFGHRYSWIDVRESIEKFLKTHFKPLDN